VQLISFRRQRRRIGLLAVLLVGLAALLASGTARAEPGSCNGEISPKKQNQGGPKGSANGQLDLKIDKKCWIDTAGTYVFGNINIVGPNGSLEFREPAAKGTQVNFWAANIIVENGGTLKAGTEKAPYGSRAGVLTIYLYGPNQSKGLDPNVDANQGRGALCLTDMTDGVGPCGIPTKKAGGNDIDAAWSNNGTTQVPIEGYPATDYFYQYGPMFGDMRCTNPANPDDPALVLWKVTDSVKGTGACSNPSFQPGYFGYKVLAVSYGGSLQLFGYKGTPLPKAPPPTRLFRFFGNRGNFNSQNSIGAPSQSQAQGAASGGGGGSAFFKLVQRLNGGGNGGGGNGGGGGGAGGGSGGEDVTCASKVAVGANSLAPDDIPTSTGCSWLRLNSELAKDGTKFTLSNATDDRWWSKDDPIPDELVVTTTDYLPGHSEKRTISGITDGNSVTLSAGVTWPHRGSRFPLADRLGTNSKRFTDAGMDPDLIKNGVETRAAVALLTRSIRIVSGGDGPNQQFDTGPNAAQCQGVADLPAGSCYSFGAHVVFRQGFKKVQIQGVEFAKLGQPGKLGHYPLHFHMARQVAPDTFIKDSTINESMTRWIVLHSTQGVLMQRNIGYKSIGHGFYLESGTETDNKFYSNLGIFARASVDNPQNPRKLPGILGYTGEFFKTIIVDNKPVTAPLPADAFPWRTDYQHPTVFWITNGWNDFIGNMAAGAGACGASYWFVPAWNSDMPDVKSSSNVEFKTHMKWNGFAALQKDESLAGSTPLKSFYGNYATSSMTSFQTIAVTAPCPGPDWPGDPAAKNPGHFPGIASFAPTPEAPSMTDMDMYYPHIGGGGRMATKCPADGKGGYNCTSFTSGQISSCNNGKGLATCAVTVLDHYTSSFHWAETNFSAIWLRPQWYLVDNSVLTDVQNGGLSFITSGTYDRSAVVEGDWAVVRTSVFIGNTQKEGTNSFASNLTPFQHTLKPDDGLPCGNGNQPSLMCASKPEGVSFPMSNFGVSQRLFSIYDGPAYQESNLYLDISPADCKECVYSRLPGIRKQTKTDKGVTTDNCYLPNAAIAWKQPNGFFYPPSFHSSNLFFDNVKIRHYVIDALFEKNTYLDNAKQIKEDYCDFSGTFPSFGNFSDIDRQTELNDDDGTLTGLLGVSKVKVNGVDKDVLNDTISVNPVEFFNAPVETAECLSNIGVTGDLACPVNKVLPKTPTPAGAKTSPYDYVTTVVFPQCGIGPLPKSDRAIQRKCGDDNYTEGGGTRFTHILGRGGLWSQECSNPACYGVPLYRQFLTGTSTSRELQTWNTNCSTDAQRATDACRWPFVRMGGQSTYQRSSLTANHGTYFLDTNVSFDTQWQNKEQGKKEAFTNVIPCDNANVKPSDPCTPRSVNVFKGGQTYYMFFLFAKPETKQTYQIYVGQGFTFNKSTPDAPTNDVRAISPVLDSMPMPSISTVNWPAKWVADYNTDAACGVGKAGCGILQVTVDFSGQTDLDPRSQCKPATFCQAKGSACGCSLTASDPLALADPVRMDSTGSKQVFGGILGACEKACSQWAVKDLDFPGKGPLGFSFKMPAGFVADDKGWSHRPAPQPFPTTQDTGQPDWLTTFINTAIEPDHSKGDCHYAKLPTNTTGDCQIP